MAISARSPAVRKVVWADRLPGRLGGEQPLVAGKTSVDAILEFSSQPPVRRSRVASLEEPEDLVEIIGV